jgi:hypothetical protein
MPLSNPVAREHLHTRSYDFRGYRRKDGLWDIEGRITDVKTYGFPNRHRGEVAAGEPVHDMWVRLTLDDHFTVVGIEVTTDAGPFRICPDVAPNFQILKGERIKRGWHQRLKDLLGNTQGCVHLVEMIGSMGTVAFQTMYHARSDADAEKAGDKRPGIIDTCHALASDGPVVKELWPAFYTGE